MKTEDDDQLADTPMVESPPTVDDTIARYRAELVAEANLATNDLDEIEDHLRCLTADLRASGMPTAHAVTEAARRLGNPRELAREHARISSPFGARISRLRAWSAVALLAPFAIWYGLAVIRADRYVSLAALETVLATGLMICIALRLSWARAFTLGTVPVTVGAMLVWALTWGDGVSNVMVAQILCYAGVAVMLAPWRRGELSWAGVGLALMGPAYHGVATALSLQMTNGLGDSFGMTIGLVALVGVLLGALGSMFRARWGAFAALGASLALAVLFLMMVPLQVNYSHAGVWRALVLASVGFGSLAAFVGAALCWRHARSTVGTLRGLLA